MQRLLSFLQKPDHFHAEDGLPSCITIHGLQEVDHFHAEVGLPSCINHSLTCLWCSLPVQHETRDDGVKLSGTSGASSPKVSGGSSHRGSKELQKIHERGVVAEGSALHQQQVPALVSGGLCQAGIIGLSWV